MLNNQVLALRPLGRSDLKLSALGLGCWQFSLGNGMVGKYWPVLPQEDIVEIVRISIEGGINWFDTAEVYGKGNSERALAHALNTLGEAARDVLVATKWWPLMRTAKSLTDTIDERLQALDGRRIDLYQIHQPYSLSGIRAQMQGMAKLLRDGVIRTAGVSNFSAKQMREAHRILGESGFQLVSNQVKYSLLDRRIEDNGILETAQELGITIIAYSPLEQGLLSGKFHKNPELLQSLKGPRRYFSTFKEKNLIKSRPLIDLLDQLADKYGVSISQVALNWLINYHGETVVAIPGASKVQHAIDNIGALHFALTRSEMEEIDRVAGR